VNSGGTLRIGTGGTAGNVSGTISNGSVVVFNRSNTLTLGATISGPGDFIQAGPGTLNITNANNFTGAFMVNGGKLNVNNPTGSATGTGTLTVGEFGTLGGTGTVQDAWIDGTLMPGNSAGTLTVSNLTLTSSANLLYELGATNDVNDLVVVTGNLTLSGYLNVSTTLSFGPGQYPLFTYGTIAPDPSLQLSAGYPPQYTYAINYDTLGVVYLDVFGEVIPEPETLALVGGGLLFLIVLRRRRS
jgi:fibronectin-binding autotransporter adhesin